MGESEELEEKDASPARQEPDEAGFETEVEVVEAEEGPGDDDEEDDEDDEEEDFEEAGAYGQHGMPDAPWSPTPTWVAQRYIQDNPDTAVDFNFPTVYEENRTEKIADLATSQELQVISHQRMSTLIAQEIGVGEDYDYAAEQADIKQEKKTLGPLPIIGLPGVKSPKAPGAGGADPFQPGPGITSELGAGDDLARAVGVIRRTAGDRSRTRDDHQPKRADLSHAAQRAFRRDQREDEGEDEGELGEAFRALAHELRRVREALRGRLTEAAEELPLAQRLDPTEVLYMEDGGPKRCDRCMMWIRDRNRCTIHRPQDTVQPDQVCYLYVNGPPGSAEEGAEAEGYVTPEISGLGEGNTSCGTCRFGNGRPNCAHPALKPFQIDNVGGCCNAWRNLTGKPRETVAGRSEDPALRRLAEGLVQLARRLPTKVEVRPEVRVQPPAVHVEVQSPPARPVRYERDSTGAIIRSVPEEPTRLREGEADAPPPSS